MLIYLNTNNKDTKLIQLCLLSWCAMINIHQEPGQELEPEMAEPTDSLVFFGVELPSGCLSFHQITLKEWSMLIYTQLQKKPISHFSGQLWKS